MKRIGILLTVFLFVVATSLAGATTLDFEDQNNLGIILAGDMTWNGKGGGHLYNEGYLDDDSIMGLNGAYVNSFEMNAMPWENYGGGRIGLIDIEAFNSSNSSVWTKTVDLTNYTSWDNWLIVSVETDDVDRIVFYAPGEAPHENGFWPSVDNLIINENSVSPVPEPATMLLFGMGILTIIGIVRKKTA